MLCGVFLALPVHAGGLSVVDLHAVHADVAFPCFWVSCDDARKSDEATSVMRPASENGEVENVEALSENDLPAGCVFGGNGLWEKFPDVAEHRKHLQLFEKG